MPKTAGDGGGAIKISGATATINNANLNQELKDLQKKLDTDMEKTFPKKDAEQLQERIAALEKWQEEEEQREE